jgi:hypothetical protein
MTPGIAGWVVGHPRTRFCGVDQVLKMLLGLGILKLQSETPRRSVSWRVKPTLKECCVSRNFYGGIDSRPSCRSEAVRKLAAGDVAPRWGCCGDRARTTCGYHLTRNAQNPESEQTATDNDDDSLPPPARLRQYLFCPIQAHRLPIGRRGTHLNRPSLTQTGRSLLGGAPQRHDWPPGVTPRCR